MGGMTFLVSNRRATIKPNLKRNFGISVEEKLEFWSENVDLGVFDIAEFKFWGLESKFEKN